MIFVKKNYKILLVMFLAALLRIYGVWHDYPFSFYPDEVHFVKRALSFGSFDFNPHWFHKPAFYMYLLCFEYGIYFLVGKIMGLWSTVSEYAVAYIKNPGPLYIIGRLTTVLFSMGSILIIYRIGERHFRPGVGIVAALLLSLCYGHVVASQDVKADIIAMFFVTASIFSLLDFLKAKELKCLILSSLLAGVGAATKEYPIIMLVPITMSVIFIHNNAAENIGQRIRKIAFYIGIVLAVFYVTYFICSPYSFLDPQGRYETFESFYVISGKIQQLFGAEKITNSTDFINQRTGLFQGYIRYIQVLIMTKGMGVFIAGISVSGLVYLLSQLNRQIFVFLLYPVFFGLISVLTFPGYTQSRHQLPLYPFLAICGGALIIAIAGDKGLRKKIVIAALFLCLVFPLYNIIKRDLHVSKQDTRNVAKVWIESHIPPGTKVLLDENGPQLLTSERHLENMLKMAAASDSEGPFTAHYGTYLHYQMIAAKDSVTYDLDLIRFPWWMEKEVRPGVYHATSKLDSDAGNPLRPLGVMPYEYYEKNEYKYIIVASNRYGRYFRKDSRMPELFPSFYLFYKTLFKKGRFVKNLNPMKQLKGQQ